MKRLFAGKPLKSQLVSFSGRRYYLCNVVLHHAECNPVPHYIVASFSVYLCLCKSTLYVMTIWCATSWNCGNSHLYICLLSCNIISLFYDCPDQVSFIICNLRQRVWNIYSFYICMIICRAGLFLLHHGAVELVPDMAELMKERWDCREEGCGWREQTV